MIRRLASLFAAAALLAPAAAPGQAPEPIAVTGGVVRFAPGGEGSVTGGLRLVQGTLTITGEGGTYNATTQAASVTGGVTVVRGDERITADRGTYNGLSQVVAASGNVVLTRGADRLLANDLEYNLATRAFRSGPVRLGRFPYYAEGSSAEGTATETVIHDATLTLGEPGPFTPTSAVRRLVVHASGTVEADGVRVGIGRTVGIRVPQFRGHISQGSLAFLSLSTGYRGSLGAFVDASVHLPLGPALQLGGDLGLYTARGLMFGPSGRYTSASDPARLDGAFRSGYINDHGDKATDLLGRPVPEDRGYIEWQHRQRIGERLRLTAALNYWKDSEIVRDFRPDSFFPVQQPDTFLSAVHAGNNFFLSAFARFQPNRFHAVQERLPELRFDFLPRDIGHGLYEQFQASAVRLREDPVGGGPSLRSDRLDAYYAIQRPFHAADWFSFTPVAGGRITHYANTEGAAVAGGYTRALGEVGFDAALRLAGVFDYRNETWGIHGLRHLLTPRLGYRYMPDGDRGRDRIPLIDRRTFATYLPTLGLGGVRHLDDLRPVETLRVGLDNTLQTRDATYGSRDLLTFNHAVDFRYRRLPGVFDISEIHSELSLTPAPWIRWDVYESFEPQNFTLRQLNTALTLRDGDVWSLRFANHYLRRDTEEYLLQVSRRLNEAFELEARLRYDARQSRFNEEAIVLRQNLANAWELEYAVALYDGPRRESNFGFRFRIGTVGF